MTFQLLISAVDAQVNELLSHMKLESDAVLVNQCDIDSDTDIEFDGHRVRVISQSIRGVGNSRNAALNNSTADICLFSDEDIVYASGYKQMVLSAFEAHPEASVITFNFQVDERRRTYFNEAAHEIRWNNYGRYPAYAIAIRRQDILEQNIQYSALFGGGAKYSNGEDSLFLHDCLNKGLGMWAETAILGHEEYRESTWFKGYTDKFFFDRGVLYHFLYGKAAMLLGARFLAKNRKEMLKETTFFKAYSLLLRGIREGKNL